MDADELKMLVANASEEKLRGIVLAWMEADGEFRNFVEHTLDLPDDEIDFSGELAKGMTHEALQCVGRHEKDILNWSNINYYHIQPWAKKAESFRTASLRNLVEAIVTQVAMAIDDDDFTGDDWYGDDYSLDIKYILETLGNLFGLLIVRPDLTDSDLNELKEMVEEAQLRDKCYNYINTPYDLMLTLIDIRRESGEVSGSLYDMMTEANFNLEAGIWICRKADFLRSIGKDNEAISVIDDNLNFPEVCLKRYGELVAEERWDEAIELIDRAIKLREENSCNRFAFSINPDWLTLKQNILEIHGSREAQIDNLMRMFRACGGEKKREYYSRLKELVGESDWKDFYTRLLSGPVTFGMELDAVAPFLIMEKEYDWLYRQLEENELRDKTDYRTPLKYAEALKPYHDKEMRAMLVRTFRNYAADRFGLSRKVKTGKYAYFCQDLGSLADIGAVEELKELLQYFKETYRRRPSLMCELRKIKTV